MAWEQRLLRTLASFTITYAKTVIIGSLVLTALAATYTVQHLQFISDRNDLVSAEKRYLQLDEEYTREFMGVDELVVIVEPRDVKKLRLRLIGVDLSNAGVAGSGYAQLVGLTI